MISLNEVIRNKMEGEFDVRGKKFLITGGDKGLGLETIRRLVLGGGSVIIGCREKKYFGENYRFAKAQFCKNLNCDVNKVSIRELDLSNLKSVEKFCQNVLEESSTLDVIICNAGVMSYDGNSRVSEEGLELHFAVNYLGHFLIVNNLLGILKKSTDPRVIVVSSILLKDGQINRETLGSPDNTRYINTVSGSKNPAGYADSKLMCSLFVKELQNREPTISVFSVSPGWCKTSLGRSANIAWYQYPAILILMSIFGNSIKQGADSIVFCAASNQVQHLRGKFVRSREIFEKIENVLELQGGNSNLLWQKTIQILSELKSKQQKQ